MKNVLQGKYERLGEVDEEDDSKFLIPTEVTPHNKPWDNNYKKMGTLD